MEETLTQPRRVQEEGSMNRKLLLFGKNGRLLSWCDGTE